VLLEYPIYPGRANSVKIAIKNNGAVIDHSAITRLALYVGTTLFDSQVTPALFDLTNAGHVEIHLGNASPALAVGRYPCKLIIYDAGEYAQGFIVPVPFVVQVFDEDGA
jgi:hypothetical protein